MKKIILLVIAAFVCGSAAAQINLLKRKVLIGEIQNEKINFVADSKSFLKAINNKFPEGYDHVEIRTDETIGERTEKFYYLDITSSRNGARLVRWLTNKDGKLYMENTNSSKTEYKAYYTACKGAGDCQPKLLVDKNEMHWTCGDKPEEQASLKPAPCDIEITILTRY